jgi:hypothetical protein
MPPAWLRVVRQSERAAQEDVQRARSAALATISAEHDLVTQLRSTATEPPWPYAGGLGELLALLVDAKREMVEGVLAGESVRAGGTVFSPRRRSPFLVLSGLRGTYVVALMAPAIHSGWKTRPACCPTIAMRASCVSHVG